MNLVGVAIGFIQPSVMVEASNNTNVVEYDLKSFYISQLVAAVVFFFVTLFYKERPPTPPTSLQQPLETNLSFVESLKCLGANKYFIFLSQSYAIYFALFVAIFVLVNPLITSTFKTADVSQIGWMGFWTNIVAVVSFLVIGRLLDRYKKYQLTAVLLNVSSMVLWLVFVLVLRYTNSFTALYVIYLALGVVFVPFFATGIETAAEMTYPVSEETSSTVMLVFGNLYAFAMIYGFGMLASEGFIATTGFAMVGLYFLSSLFAGLAETDLKRSTVQNGDIS